MKFLSFFPEIPSSNQAKVDFHEKKKSGYSVQDFFSLYERHIPWSSHNLRNCISLNLLCRPQFMCNVYLLHNIWLSILSINNIQTMKHNKYYLCFLILHGLFSPKFWMDIQILLQHTRHLKCFHLITSTVLEIWLLWEAENFFNREIWGFDVDKIFISVYKDKILIDIQNYLKDTKQYMFS